MTYLFIYIVGAVIVGLFNAHMVRRESFWLSDEPTTEVCVTAALMTLAWPIQLLLMLFAFLVVIVIMGFMWISGLRL